MKSRYRVAPLSENKVLSGAEQARHILLGDGTPLSENFS
jgi:hypothetical protein